MGKNTIAIERHHYQFALPEEFDRGAAATLARKLLGRRPGMPLVIDGRAVRGVATAGIQVLLSADRSSAATTELTIVDPSPALCGALEDLGFADELRRWRVRT